MNSNKGTINIFFIILLVLGLFLSFLISNLLRPTSKSILKPSPLLSPKSDTRSRIVYDFTKILREEFLIFKDAKLGFSIEYPSEMKIYHEDKNETSYDTSKKLDYMKEINFSLVSQTAEGTELFDGLSIILYYYKNPNKRSLDSIIPQKKIGNYFQEGDLTEREQITVNNIEGIKTHVCCWGGGDIVYYFPIKNGLDILVVDIFSVGPDKEKFNEIANKMVNSLKLIN